MIETPQITQSTFQHAAIVRLTITREEIRNVMGPGLSEVLAAIEAQGLAPISPWYTHHLRMEPDLFDFEIGVPIATPLAATGRVQPGTLPATTVARTTYHGPYEGLGPAWGEFEAWIAREKLAPAEDLWECYLVGPESSDDPADWRTQLNRPLLTNR